MSGVEEVVTLAGRSLRIEANSARACLALLPALAHLRRPCAAGEETRWAMVEEHESWRPRGFPGAGAYRTGNGGLAVVQDDPASVESYHPEIGIELRAAPAAFASGNWRANPACYAIAAWLGGPSTQVVHAAAVAYGGAAALIVGAGGAGKSTTALACALAGADYLGDDLVVVEAGGENGNADPAVHCLYATAKLNPDSARALGAEAWPSLGVTHRGKTVVAVEHGLRVVRCARIIALIVLAPRVEGVSHPAPMAMPKGLVAIAPTASSLAWRASTPAAWLATMASLARRLPAYRLPVTWELDALAEAVHEVVHQAAGRADEFSARLKQCGR